MIIIVVRLLIFLVEWCFCGLVLLLCGFSVFMCDLIFLLVVCPLLCGYVFMYSWMIIFFFGRYLADVVLLFYEITWYFVILCVVMWLF